MNIFRQDIWPWMKFDATNVVAMQEFGYVHDMIMHGNQQMQMQCLECKKFNALV